MGHKWLDFWYNLREKRRARRRVKDLKEQAFSVMRSYRNVLTSSGDLKKFGLSSFINLARFRPLLNGLISEMLLSIKPDTIMTKGGQGKAILRSDSDQRLGTLKEIFIRPGNVEFDSLFFDSDEVDFLKFEFKLEFPKILIIANSVAELTDLTLKCKKLGLNIVSAIVVFSWDEEIEIFSGDFPEISIFRVFTMREILLKVFNKDEEAIGQILSKETIDKPIEYNFWFPFLFFWWTR